MPPYYQDWDNKHSSRVSFFGQKKVVVMLVILLILAILLGVSGYYRTLIHVLFYGVYTNPIFWALFWGVIGMIVVAVIVDSYDHPNLKAVALISVLVLSVALGLRMLFANASMMVGIFEKTNYEAVSELTPVNKPRNVSYSEASTNFKNQNPEAGYAPGDQDYVLGKWISEMGPSNLWNWISMPTKGFYVYEPDSVDKVRIVQQSMPFAEGGWLWNSATWFISRKIDPFVEQHEILYVQDNSNGGYMAVTSLIKREGIRRTPYVWRILIIHSDGSTELLAPYQAEQDPRLSGIQLEPEWLAKLKVEAYGWKHGSWAGITNKRQRVQVQSSEINKENSAPYHLETINGSMWYTPYGPYASQSMTGVMMEDSHKVDSTVFVWQLPADQAYQGVDALATEIKAAPNHPDAINWLRLSPVEGGTARSGDTDIIELIPLPRKEGDHTTLYMFGYVAIDPPVKTRFYVIINAQTREVLQDTFSIEEVEQWLNGEKELAVQTVGQSASQETGSESGKAGSVDVGKLPTNDLLNLLQQIVTELSRRNK